MTKNIKKEIKKYLQTNENKDVMIQNLWNTVKAVLREKFMVIQAYLRKQEKLQISNLSLYLREARKKNKCPKLVEGKKS